MIIKNNMEWNYTVALLALSKRSRLEAVIVQTRLQFIFLGYGVMVQGLTYF